MGFKTRILTQLPIPGKQVGADAADRGGSFMQCRGCIARDRNWTAGDFRTRDTMNWRNWVFLGQHR